MPVSLDKEWVAVTAEDRIVAKADTRDRARRAAHHLGVKFDVVVAVPKNHPGGVF